MSQSFPNMLNKWLTPEANSLQAARVQRRKSAHGGR